MARRHWLVKSEPTSFSWDDLVARSRSTTQWDGVRNFQARNHLRAMRKGDRVLFYHSSCQPPHVAGVAEVAREAYPDSTAWDADSEHPDSRSTPDDPLWFMVDLRAVRALDAPVTLEDLRADPALSDMTILRRGNRLSVTPVTREEFEEVLRLAKAKARHGG